MHLYTLDITRSSPTVPQLNSPLTYQGGSTTTHRRWVCHSLSEALCGACHCLWLKFVPETCFCPAASLLLCCCPRASPGPCAEPALCTGTSSACPDNPLKPAGTVCGSSQPCKQQPFCNGQVATCPDGSNRPERTPCLRDGQTAQFPIAQAGRMSLDACRGQCAAGACQLRLNKQGCCYTSEQVNRKTVKTVHCWQ